MNELPLPAILPDAYYDIRTLSRAIGISQKLRLRLTKTLRRKYADRIALNGHSVIAEGRIIIEVLQSFSQEL